MDVGIPPGFCSPLRSAEYRRNLISLVAKPVREQDKVSNAGNEREGRSCKREPKAEDWDAIDKPCRSLFVVQSQRAGTKLSSSAKPIRKFSLQAAISLLTCSGEDFVQVMQGLVAQVGDRSYVWNEILKELESRGSRDKAWDTFVFLRDKQATYKLREQNHACIIGILSRGNQLRMAKDVLDQLVTSETQTSAFPFTILIDGYTRCGLLEEACELFEEMPRMGCKPSRVTYTVLINGCLKQRKPEFFRKAIDLFTEMKRGGISADEVLCNCIVNGLVNGRQLDAARQILEEMYDTNIVPNRVTCTNMINAYGKAGQVQESRMIFQKMREQGTPPSTWTYNAIIQGYSNNGLHEEALQLAQEMEKFGCRKDVHTYNILIALHAKEDRVDRVEATVFEMKARGISPELVTYNTLLRLYMKLNFKGKACSLLREMADAGYKPNIWTYNILLSSSLKENITFSEAEELFRDIKARGVVPNNVTYSAMINFYGRFGEYVEAKRVWDEMIEAGWAPCIIAYMGLIDSYSVHGMHEEARKWFQHMGKAGIKPDMRAYTSLMDAYGQAGLCDEVKNLFLEMQKGGHSPDGITYAVLVRSFANVGRLPEALEYLKIILDYEEPVDYLCRRIRNDYWEFYDLYVSRRHVIKF